MNVLMHRCSHSCARELAQAHTHTHCSEFTALDFCFRSCFCDLVLRACISFIVRFPFVLPKHRAHRTTHYNGTVFIWAHSTFDRHNSSAKCNKMILTQTSFDLVWPTGWPAGRVCAAVCVAHNTGFGTFVMRCTHILRPQLN